MSDQGKSKELMYKVGWSILLIIVVALGISYYIDSLRYSTGVSYNMDDQEAIFGELPLEDIQNLVDELSTEVNESKNTKKEDIDLIIERVFKKYGIEDKEKLDAAKSDKLSIRKERVKTYYVSNSNPDNSGTEFENDIRKKVKKVTGDETNRDIQKLISIMVSEDYETDVEGDMIVVIELNTDINISQEETRTRSLNETKDIFKELSKVKDLSIVTINSYYPRYYDDGKGEDFKREVFRATMSRATMDKINWSKFSIDDFESMADEYFEHLEFIEQ